MTVRKRPNKRLCIVCHANKVTTGSRSGVCRSCFIGIRRAEGRTLNAEELIEYAKGNRRLKTFLDVGMSARRWCEPPSLVRGNTMLISDLHVPKHCSVTLSRMMDVAEELGIRQLVVGGDLIDFENISRYRPGEPQSHPIESIQAATMVLMSLTDQFDIIWVIKGNHDDRLQRMIEAAYIGRDRFAQYLADLTQSDLEAHAFRERFIVVMEAWTRKLSEKLAKKVRWLAVPEIEIEGPEGYPPYRFVHPAIYSRNAPQAERRLWQRYVQPIIGTHGHIWGMSIAPNGIHPVIQIGCATDPDKHVYLSERITDHPKWVRGFASIVDGVIQCHVMNPYLMSEEN